MGSELWLGNERVWPNVKTIFTNPEIFLYPSSLPAAQPIIIIAHSQGNMVGRYYDVDYLSGNVGDGSVLEKSAFLSGSDIHPVQQHHGSLFIDSNVNMRLKLELTRSY